MAAQETAWPWGYSGTPLLWTPWGPGEVPCIERCPHFFRGNLLLRNRTWDVAKCPKYRDVFTSGCPL